ncbi:MAG: hypothetical protein IJP68_12140 [Selenomonadaceae bacterium]|nr:hypothetical protein [Selenomonadaceae bacterium]
MRYNITGDFTKITETAGTIQNVSNVYTVEVSDKAEADSGIFLYPLNKFSFTDKTLFVRCVDINGHAEIRVTDFPVDSGGIVSGGSSSANVATDEQIDNLLDDLFPLP